MPEGDTIHRAAAVLGRHLAGRPLTGFRTRVPAVAARAERAGMEGRQVESVEARGKHLLVWFSGDLVLHTHMRMTGSWHVYGREARWRKPARLARVVLETAETVAPCFSAPVVELLTADEARRHPVLHRLGPDLAGEGADLASALERLRGRGEREVGVALMDQSTAAGIGNVYKSEVLFLEGIDPFAMVGEVSRVVLERALARAHRLLRANLGRGPRRTRRSLVREGRLWVYRRAGKPCRSCGTDILMRRQGEQARSTYFCPICQSVSR